MSTEHLLIFVAVTWISKAAALANDNLCLNIIERTEMVNDEVVTHREPVLQCCEGYITVKQDCKPYCGNCANGVCVKPNDCRCNTGYLWNKTSRSCEPECDCRNGYCPTPFQCVCFQGYEKSTMTSNDCQPVCDFECPQFFTCTKHNTCECKKNTHTGECELQVCGENYRPDIEANRCVLRNCSCRSGGYCLNNYEECICYAGFRQTYGHDGYRCEPVCQTKCENAECVGPNQCECWLDYHVTDNTHICESNELCQHKLCENGECLQTGECKCKKGFTKSFTFTGQLLCETITVFIGKIMSIIVGIPLALASVVLLVVYIVARTRNTHNAVQQYEDEGEVVYASN